MSGKLEATNRDSNAVERLERNHAVGRSAWIFLCQSKWKCSRLQIILLIYGLTQTGVVLSAESNVVASYGVESWLA